MAWSPASMPRGSMSPPPWWQPASKNRWQVRQQGSLCGRAEGRGLEGYAAWADQVRSSRQRGRRFLYPPPRKGERQVRQQDREDLQECHPVLDLRREEFPGTAGLFAQLPASEDVMDTDPRAPSVAPAVHCAWPRKLANDFRARSCVCKIA